jgi:large subunit ribosomal protein L28
MPRVCVFTGRKTTVGHTYTHRGKAKYLGGVGVKVTGKTKRTFKPNVHRITAMVDGSMKRITVSTKAMKNGKVIKPLQRRFTYRKTPAQVEAGVSQPTTPETTAPQASGDAGVP